MSGTICSELSDSYRIIVAKNFMGGDPFGKLLLCRRVISNWILIYYYYPRISKV
jgi:hypothetical protein